MIELMIGIGVLVAIVVFSWWGKDDRSKNVCKEQPPGDIFRALGAVLKDDYENEDGSFHTYVVQYQGALFAFDFRRNSPWVNVQLFGFKQCASEHLNKAYAAANSINLFQSAWNCTITIDESVKDGLSGIEANLDHLFSAEGDLDKITKDLQELMGLAFNVARKFSEQIELAIKEKEEMDEAFFTNHALAHKIAILNHQKEAHRIAEATDADTDRRFRLSAARLVQLYDNADFGCLLSMKIMHGEQVEHLTDISAIMTFDVRDYILQHPQPTMLGSIVLIYEFEHQELFVNLTKAKGSTDATLYYIVNVVRSGSELDKFMDKRSTLNSHTMLEVRLTDDDKAAWEVKYMLDDAMDKVTAGKESELTDEQRLAVSHTQPSVQADLYWGKKYFTHGCYYQALYYFNHVFRAFHIRPLDEWDEVFSDVFYEVSYYIGYIYADLGMNDRACYYLNIAKSNNRINHIEEFINCLTNMRDLSAKQLILSYIKDLQERMNNDEGEMHRLMPLFQFFQRRYLYLLVEYKKWDEAEKQANFMVKNDIDVEFAKDELEYIRKMREEDKKYENK